MSRLINADKYMNHLRANINSTSDIIAKQIKKDKPMGTVADGGQIGYLNALQWARASLECDCYTVNAIVIPEGATNGDMIKTLFPNIEIEGIGGLEGLQCVAVSIGLGTSYFALDWWNSPYKSEVEE